MKIKSLYKTMILTLFSIVYFGMSGFIVINDVKNSAFTANQLRGLHYHQALMSVFVSLKNSDPHIIQKKIDAADAALLQTPPQWLNTAQWLHIKKAIAQDGTERKSFLHLRPLMLDIGDKSNLILDPELTSYYLMNIIINIAPSLLEENASIETQSLALTRSISIIESDQELKAKVYTPKNFDIEEVKILYLSAHDLLKKVLSERLDQQRSTTFYTITFLLLLYAGVIILAMITFNNYVSAEELQSAREKKKILEKLESANNELEQFAYVAAHDLKEPVRMIANFATLLERNYHHILDETGRRYTLIMRNSAKRMEQMISDLLTYCRTDRDQEDHYMICNCNKSLSYALENLQPLIKEHKASITCGDLPIIKINPTYFTRIIQNLVSNAITYSLPERIPEISITATQQGQYHQFTVQDNGIGISPVYAETIFEPFRRLHSHSHKTGTGMGLAICKKIIERAGGKIWVESGIGIGSKFHFTFPKVD